MTEYVIYSKILSNRFEEIIEEYIYDNLSSSKEILSEVLAREKIYNIILMNYYEFEKELFEITLQHEIYESDYSNFNEYMSKIEQRVLNLLSSITLYLDSFRDDLKDIEKYSSHLKDEFRNIAIYIEDAYKNDNQIKMMKLLRNHIQHNGLLVTNASLNGVNLSDELREQTLELYIKKNKIKARGLKKDYFMDSEEDINLKNIIRVYMDFISQVHQKFREVTDDKVQKARCNFKDILEKYSMHKNLHVSKKIDAAKVDEISIFLNLDDVRIEMIKQNRVPKAFKRHSINTK